VESHLPNQKPTISGRWFLAIAGGYGALAIGFGAYRAHGLPKALQASGIDPAEVASRVSNLGIAVEYTLLHAVAIVALVAFKELRFRKLSCFAFASGITLFSGSLTLSAIWAWQPPSFIPPVGGILLILGWVTLFPLALLRPRANQAAN